MTERRQSVICDIVKTPLTKRKPVPGTPHQHTGPPGKAVETNFPATPSASLQCSTPMSKRLMGDVNWCDAERAFDLEVKNNA
jgi:hypothetical protein